VCASYSDGCWQDPHFDDLYRQQRETMDQAARRDIVYEAQRYEYEQVPGVALAYPGWLQAYRSDRFTDFVPAPGPHGYLLPGYNYDSLVSIRPVAAGGTTPAAPGVAPWVWVVGGVAAVAIVAGIAVRARRRGVEEA
jgi:peptide/nickel transport system substrate-binding protein